MHVHYDSTAFVFGGVSLGEANRYLTLFTKELGLVSAVARSVRAEHSKLRPLLQELSEVDVTLVRGREVWRVTGAVLRRRLPETFKTEPERLKLAARLSLLLRRLLPGEERNPQLFDLYADTIRHLENVPEASLPELEQLAALRMLGALGYRSRKGAFQVLLDSTDMEESMFAVMRKYRHEAVAELNELINASQL
ncbi:DNA repair protein RecO [Candidatus Kaiserbacteria bacterium RIFCSPHIGHO2_01_FULL_49_13]|uniref:DNA repair protein RecO n=1 Tax=Candidatus Kaiserbacteria bacterium RIFCSPHIGHO2_01_FULL_49_13 TaxID=1798477 RepID=A0A1F6CE78_9BACT|nr:MAG: DNA repair protein RecO [Candidatus Kaiserbacteria bacterium RIFCSPHIGHO2_01_FULL_49_13]